MLVGTIEISRFKAERVASYYKMVRLVAQEELKLLGVEVQFWRAVIDSKALPVLLKYEEYRTIARGNFDKITGSLSEENRFQIDDEDDVPNKKAVNRNKK